MILILFSIWIIGAGWNYGEMRASHRAAKGKAAMFAEFLLSFCWPIFFVLGVRKK
jgi:hypothetical protein